MRVQQLTLPSKNTVLPSRHGYDTVTSDTMDGDIKVIALIKGDEQYVFLYNESNRGGLRRLLGQYASNPELSFTWYDAAVLSRKICQESQQQTWEKQRAESSRVPIFSDDFF